MKTQKNNISQNLSMLRKLHKYSQEDVAEQIGVSRQTVAKWETGETGDIYLVADVLGHRDVNTTRKHYAAISGNRRREAAEVIRLREDPPEFSPEPSPAPIVEKFVESAEKPDETAES